VDPRRDRLFELTPQQAHSNKLQDECTSQSQQIKEVLGKMGQEQQEPRHEESD